MAEKGSQPWSTGLFECFGSFDRFCFAFWCPCMSFAKTKARLRDPTLSQYDGSCNDDCCNYYMWGCMAEAPMRAKMRERWGLQGDTNIFNSDICLTLCCPACTLAQEEREVIFRTTQEMQQTGYSAEPPMQMQMQPQQQQAPELEGKKEGQQQDQK